jgi:hypothetical protein
MAVAGLAMRKSLGHVLATGPTNVAVDNLAARIDRISRSVCACFNEGKVPDDPTRARHAFVVRGYGTDLEVEAVLELLRNPDSRWQKGPWQLELSAAYWLLVLLRSSGARFGALHPDDSTALHDLQREFDGRADLANFRNVATGNMTMSEFESAREEDGTKDGTKGEIRALLAQVVGISDILATTPAQSIRGAYDTWVRRTSRAILIDEAANMHRADLAWYVNTSSVLPYSSHQKMPN